MIVDLESATSELASGLANLKIGDEVRLYLRIGAPFMTEIQEISSSQLLKEYDAERTYPNQSLADRIEEVQQLLEDRSTALKATSKERSLLEEHIPLSNLGAADPALLMAIEGLRSQLEVAREEENLHNWVSVYCLA